MSVSEKTLNLIKEDKVKQKPKWEFVLKEVLIWGLFILSFIIAALALGVSFFVLQENDIDLRLKVNSNLFQLFLEGFPLLLLLLFIIFVAFVYINFRHTKYGYKYSTPLLIMTLGVPAVIFGGILFITGLGREIDRIAIERIPVYQSLVNPNKELMWCNPEAGLLAGEVLEIRPMDQTILLDFEDTVWTIKTQDLPMSNKFFIREGRIIKIIGVMESNNVFKANEVRPWSNKPSRESIRNKILQNSL